MNIRLLFDLYKGQKITVNRSLSISTLLRYYIRLKVGELTRKIYKSNSSYCNADIPFMVKVMETVDSSIEETLGKIKLGNEINISQKKGLENIGTGCVITPAMFGRLIVVTQHEASFYFPTNITKEWLLNLNLLAIAKISGHVKFEDKKIYSFSIPTLTEQKVSLKIEPTLISTKISKITITVDQCWSPHFLDKQLPNYPMGVGVRSIELV